MGPPPAKRRRKNPIEAKSHRDKLRKEIPDDVEDQKVKDESVETDNFSEGSTKTERPPSAERVAIHGRSFGQRRPPLTKLIKSILVRYPDGGQILKELIQNADDAGATEVKFLYDHQSFGTNYVSSPELSKFQGPALYCYNNAIFREEDWEGIQNIMRSNKKDDPLKVGRFGIGFNSVYHITDLPGIASGGTVGFLDPHERYFGRGEFGRCYDIKDGLLRPSLKDQFEPFHGLFGCDLASTSTYAGTLFRFPLRNTPSKLSKKLYTASMVENLFESLRDEASVILLFLKSVMSISIYERRESGRIDCVFTVEVSPDTQAEVKRKRQDLLQEAKQPSRITESKVIFNICITAGLQIKTYRWLVVNQLGSNQKRILNLRDTLCLLPWIGLAIPINTTTASEGRIFCFLPLPPDDDCQTGLPVHIHGYFGLTDNRRGITWPGAECQNNETAEWNELLLKDIGSVVYSKMLQALVTNQPDMGISHQQRTRLVYSTLPVLENVRGHWRCILTPLFQKLLDERLFYAKHASRSSWIALGEGVLDLLRESGTSRETHRAVLSILLQMSQMIITDLPSHVQRIVKTRFPTPKIISPPLVRNVLKNSDIRMTPRSDKLRLLEYVLSDGKTSDISGVPLLLLADGNDTSFRQHKHNSNPSASVFVPSGKCTAALLPNMSGRFLDGNLPQDIFSQLYAIAASNTNKIYPTQLVRLTNEIVCENMRASLPQEWFSLRGVSDKVAWNPGISNHPPRDWLEAVWTWIKSSFPSSLTKFRGLPLIPCSNYLGVLSQSSKFIFASGDIYGNAFPLAITEILINCGCSVVSKTPHYLRHQDISTYIAPPTAAGVLTVLSRVPLGIVQEHVQRISTPANRSVLRDFFAPLPTMISDSQRNLLIYLPLFDTLAGGSTAAVGSNGKTLKAVSSEFSLPAGFQFLIGDMIISPSDANAVKLLRLLRVQIVNPAEVLIEYLFPDISNHLYSSRLQINVVMLWILERMSVFKSQNPAFLEHLKKLPFVLTKSGKRKRPADLYDPDDAVLCGILHRKDDVFPTGDFLVDEIISKLKLLGLKTRATLAASDLYRFAVIIASSGVSPASVKRANALVTILNDNPSFLNQYVNQSTLKHELFQLKWIPSAPKPPQNYPDCMPWFKCTSFFSPDDIYSFSKASLVGSSMPTVGVNMNNQLEQQFHMTRDPPISQVVKQLKAAVESWTCQKGKEMSAMKMAQFQEMLTGIYLFLSRFSPRDINSALEQASVRNWVWHGKGFCLPTNVALSKDFGLDLRPRLFLLQNEFKANSVLTKFFLQHGVRNKFSDSDILGVLHSIQKKHKDPVEVILEEIEQDLELCLAILQWVVKDGKVLSETLQEKVLVPVQGPETQLILEPCKKCTYCDRDWLRQGGTELDIPGDYQIVHDSVSEKVARLLGVPPLSTCLLSAETLGFEQTGPYESITNRLKTILQEYKEGVGIFKELIQNADDAAATEVCFLVDWRMGPKQRLLSPKMAECQGPALWAYNDAVFSDEDFENINKLAGATKVEYLGKIGRFGLGFNAVYHMTDVPSFVSREYFYVFDPNVNHLERHIKDKSRPGIRINLASNPSPLSAFEDQFELYNNVFHCSTKVTGHQKFHYNGTLFRFPFRTPAEARESEICKNVYHKDKVKQIVDSLKESSSLLLLYTQHVKQVKLYEVGNGRHPSQMELVLSITKNAPEIVRHGSSFSSKQPFIRECSTWWKKKLTSGSPTLADPSRCELVKISTDVRPSNLITSKRQSVKHEEWVVTSGVGTDSSVLLASGDGRYHGLLPCAGAAARLSSKKFRSSARLAAESIEGEVFCFLPLSIPTGFPVHVNGYFAITSNRRGIWKRTTSRHSQQPIEVRWNECLMEDALSNVYIQLLNDMKSLSSKGLLQKYVFHDLWPRYAKLQSNTWERLVKSVYMKLVNDSLPLWCSEGKWLTMDDGYILSEELASVPRVTEILQLLDKNVFNVPSGVVSSLIKSGQSEAVRGRTLNFKTFLETLFFPSIREIPQEIRDPVVCYILDCILRGPEEFVHLFHEYPCITCSKDGRQLAKPSDLVNPTGPIAKLFSPEDNRFPVGKNFLTKNRIYALERLRMVKDRISWHEVCGRAESVRKVAAVSYEKGRERARNLIEYLNGNMHNLPKIQEEVLVHLRRIKFLPFISQPPDGYGLPWKGTEFAKHAQFLAPNDVFMPGEKHLVGSSCPIIDVSDKIGCGKLNNRVKDLLGFFDHQPTVEQVLQQLDAAIESQVEKCDGRTAKKDTLVSVCKKVYKFFNDVIVKAYIGNDARQRNMHCQTQRAKTTDFLLNELNRRTWIFIQGRFLSREKVAYNWSGNGAPYLFGLPYEYKEKYENLMTMAGVRPFFQPDNFIQALYMLQDAKKGSSLTNEELKLAACFLTELKDKDVVNHLGEIPLPDANGVLCRSNELTINMTFSLKDRGDARYVHGDIPPLLAMELGAKSLQNRRRKKYSNALGMSFGQHEKLTDRLKSILKSYPCDSGILKELVQNADDAGATEIHFIYDTRTHPHESVLLDHANEIQGPALCVYNNRPFSEKDLEGIQKLGIGSKSDDPEKTGQYGIGFNAVYHLTDCPSFLSNNDTLCLLDPHCRYAPDASPDSPGEQFRPIDEAFKEDFKDILLGYLSEYFTLKDATMFRLPLRTAERAQESLISNMRTSNSRMQDLLRKFKGEAKKMLLFLNHIKKISLSQIDKDGKLKLLYSVCAALEGKDEDQRRAISDIMKKYKGQPTSKVPRAGITYPMTLSDSSKTVEKWLVHQCCGTQRQSEADVVPDGQQFGLFPRGGIAALVSKPRPIHADPENQPEYVAYCFLPLPVKTSLPVHVNGHFALDSSRRNLWQDTNTSAPLTKWNNFIKSRVLAPGYAALIREARKYVPYTANGPCDDMKYSFSNFNDAWLALNWYHNLFPRSSKDSSWSILTGEVYRFLGDTREPVIPVVVADEIRQTAVTSQTQQESAQNIPQRIRSWHPIQDVYFLEKIDPLRSDNKRLFAVLLRICLPLALHSPSQIHSLFKKAGFTSHLLTPRSVIGFLRTFNSQDSTCKIGQLPCQLRATNVQSALDLKVLIKFCKEEERFSSLLEGLPLLFTADGLLRMFDSGNVVYRSEFSDLFPTIAHLFVHPDFVCELPDIKRKNVPQVTRNLDAKSIAQYLPDVFPAEMVGSTKHIPWIFAKKGPLSKKWFQRLWEFLNNYAKPSHDENQVSLDILGVWPIIPTLCGKLVTINNGKTVLDVTQRKTETAQERYVRKVLSKMNCPSLNTEVTSKKSGNEGRSSFSSFWSPVRSSQSDLDGERRNVIDEYVAQPHSVPDVLEVFGYMTRVHDLDASRLADREVHKLLTFFQDDLAKLHRNEKFITIVRALPFFKAIDGVHYSLSIFPDHAVVPSGVPSKEIASLQRHTGCLFLHPGPADSLKDFYKAVGVGVEHSLSEFYTKYIIPFLHIFSRDNQIEYLTHIRDVVLSRYLVQMEYESFLKFLTGSRCVPDEQGNLHYAREFHDPRNEVFRIMLDENSNQFPPCPFRDPEWLDFLSEIGLKSEVKENQFLEFCDDVARVGSRSPDDKNNEAKSKVLVKYLFESAHLRCETFLCSVSSIRFIASEKVGSRLLSLHRQYQCNSVDEQPPCVQFLGATPWYRRFLTWTSTELLPSWCQPSEEMATYLGIQEIPSVDNVLTHVQNLSCTLVEMSKKDEVLSQPELLKKILVSSYRFLDKEKNCNNKDVSECCSPVCKNIGNRMRNISCVLVNDGKVLVKGDQLCFTMPNDHLYQPYLYAVPREYGTFEHLMKRLGATEHLTSLQLANILKAIKNQCQDSRINPNFVAKTQSAMAELFFCVFSESNQGKKASMISNLQELFLPSEDGFLIKSVDLVCKVPPRLKSTLKQRGFQSLFPIEKCGLGRDKEDNYLISLPSHLRPKTLNSLFKEVLDPACLQDTCPLCQQNRFCPFVERYVSILQSPEFREGIVRLLKHEKNANELSETEKERSSLFGSDKLEIRCMRDIQLHLVDTKTEKPLENTGRKCPCFVVERNGSWTLFVKHGHDGQNNLAVLLSKRVNRILEWRLQNESALIIMLLCDSPRQIPDALNQLDIREDFSEDQLRLGREVPIVFHHLLEQNPLFLFHQGEIVAYGMATSPRPLENEVDCTEETSHDEAPAMQYVLARVINRTDKSKEDEASYDFAAQYLIDIGSKQKEVSVLDLYKFYQNEIRENLTRDIVPFSGDTSVMPASLNEAKREVREALIAAWRLPPDLRRKVIRRLILRWHPDKNPDNVDFAKEVTMFLLSEIKRMEKEKCGATDFDVTELFRKCDRQARRDRETFTNFRHSHDVHGFSFNTSSDYTSPEPTEARRWIEQVQRDVEVAEYLFSDPRPFHAWVCFVSHQIVEKSLKAALYAKCGLSNNQLHTHDVYSLASDVRHLRGAPDCITDLAVVVANYYLPTRYPNRQPGAIIPADAFDREQARNAVNVARRLVETVKHFMHK